MAFKLPAKTYLSLHDLVTRWECTENDVRDLIVRGELRPSYIINHVAKKVRFYLSSEDVGTYWQSKTVGTYEDDDGTPRPKLYTTEGAYYLLHPDVTSALNCNFWYFSQDREHVKGEEDINICFMLTRRGEWEHGVTLDMVFKNGMVMLEELMRFEEPQIENIRTEKPIETREHNALNATRWPWGNHHTEALGHLEAAARRWWVNYDLMDATTMPTNAEVADWLKNERGVSQTSADAMASILRLDGLKTGPRK